MSVNKFACFCGKVEVTVTGEPIAHIYCHCTDCRASKGSEFSSLIIVENDNLTVTKGEDLVKFYNKVNCERNFCTNCGTIVFLNTPDAPFKDVYPALQISGDLKFTPTVHCHYAEKVMSVKDGLPKYAHLPAIYGGSDDMCEE
mmetsp:Transcript_24483/g.36002  ORF Transcript_24483/g.36002 Transcript_24483/m.36002 type:complete len:143 (+) Transcript_24483:68-496(+)